MKKNILSCRNLFCGLNKEGVCDAENMLDLLCSGYDIYKNCSERQEGSKLIKAIESIFGKNLVKNNKGEIGYDE